jgi:hypothetical protein
MLVRYFRRPSRIEQLRSSTGGHLLEGFAKELSQGRYQWVAARKHIRAAGHFLHWIAHRNLSITSVEERCAQQFRNWRSHGARRPNRSSASDGSWRSDGSGFAGVGAGLCAALLLTRFLRSLALWAQAHRFTDARGRRITVVGCRNPGQLGSSAQSVAHSTGAGIAA